MTSRRNLLAGAVAAAALAATGARADAAPSARPHWTVLGRTRQDRPIRAFRLGPEDAPSRYLFVGSMHGDEPAGHRVAIRGLLRKRAPDGVQLWVVPTMNPDGLAAHTRTNSRGVDLNRNFPSSDWHLQDRGTKYWSGPRAASERETRAMVRFVSDLVPHTIVSLHQPLACVDLSGGDPSVQHWLAHHLRLPAKVLGSSGGNFTSWFNEDHPRHAAHTVELGPRVTEARVQQVAHVVVQHAAHRR